MSGSPQPGLDLALAVIVGIDVVGARIDKQVKAEAAAVLESMGLSLSDAIRLLESVKNRAQKLGGACRDQSAGALATHPPLCVNVGETSSPG